MKADSPMRRFDPLKVGRFEKENYIAYYQKRWIKLMRVSVALVKEAFGLSLWQAVYAAYLVARAEIAFAPFPDNDVPLAEEYMSRFYAFLKKVHREDFDPAQAAKLEVKWWIVHRKLFAQPENQELVDALTELYAAAYDVDPVRVREAAHHRAQGMLCSDRWVNDGRAGDSPLLAEEEAQLVKSYTLLREAIQS